MDFWDELFGTQPDPPTAVILVTGGVALLLVLSGEPWRLARNVITIVHEAGHALMAVLVGRRLRGITLHSDTSGVTVSRGKPTGPGMVLTAFAGYIAPSLVGLGLAALMVAGKITLLLWVMTALMLAVLIMIRNVFGVVSVVVTGAVLVTVSLVTSPEVQAAFACLVAWFLLFGGVRPVWELQAKRRRRQARDSDADQLARLTGAPGLFWVGMFMVIAIGALFLGGMWLVEPAITT
ncbi:M50 family metallopeptidase [Kibdelosporangium philippinense]|uniref:M50 family metallopeptidase n=1 Tax=Kibdelosporangium philippinense TaxID=211113 RepID=A0ABS8ZHJ5_9PSEU|nr:M50 family metallopeptidase [Kibdelosporangium philippinense]MCE7006538.1 M50 family metallopeptidase [Kibdelosporangium philippinense]